MLKIHKDHLLQLLDQLISDRKKSLEEKHEAVLEIAQAGMGSHSINSERHITETVRDAAKDSVEDLLQLREQLVTSSDEPSEKILPPSFVKVDYEQPEKESQEFYVLNVATIIPNVKTVTPTSPLGQNLIGKSVGDKISYSIGDRAFSGTIMEIG